MAHPLSRRAHEALSGRARPACVGLRLFFTSGGPPTNSNQDLHLFKPFFDTVGEKVIRPSRRWGDGDVVRILVVDPSLELQRMLQQELGSERMMVFLASRPSEALAMLPLVAPHAILTEIAFPEDDGLQFCRRLRAAASCPILVISAAPTGGEVIQALDAGADDFICKPFAFIELKARLQAHLRRWGWHGGRIVPSYYADDHLVIDLRLQEVRVCGRRLRLSRIEYRLLACLLQHAGRVVCHEVLLRAGWEDRGWDPHYLKLYIRHLRSKIEPDPARPRYIQTVWGVGYRFCPYPSAPEAGVEGSQEAEP